MSPTRPTDPPRPTDLAPGGPTSGAATCPSSTTSDERLRLVDLECLRLEGQAAELRRAATELRHHAEALPAVLRRLDAYDRPDVWQGALADRHRRTVIDVCRRLASPSVGTALTLVEIAARLDARAAGLEAHATQLVSSAVPASPFGPDLTPWWQDPRFGPQN
jgi:hypothetical protein